MYYTNQKGADRLMKACKSVSDPYSTRGHQSKDINPAWNLQNIGSTCLVRRYETPWKNGGLGGHGDLDQAKPILLLSKLRRIGGRILFVVHNNSILEQARDAFLKEIMPGLGL